MARVSHRRLLLTLSGLVVLSALPNHAAGQDTVRHSASVSLPTWRVKPLPWLTHAGQPRPWRDDSRLSGYFEPGFPDDVQVKFPNPDSASGPPFEAMWVTVIAYDRATDQYLGLLLNQPQLRRSVEQWDNVVFRPGAAGAPPVAVALEGDYAAPGWPPSRSPEFLQQLRSGIRAYRTGRNGHHMPGIERCIDVLAPVVSAVPPDASRDERFIAHFVLGRCLAEKYETDRAIEQFRAAIALDSGEVNAHMALLAELSVKTHQLTGTRPAAEVERWDRAFLVQLAVVRQRFADDPGVAQVLQFIFDPAQEVDVDPAWRGELPRLRRIGYGVFRWKQR